MCCELDGHLLLFLIPLFPILPFNSSCSSPFLVKLWEILLHDKYLDWVRFLIYTHFHAICK